VQDGHLVDRAAILASFQKQHAAAGR
jgi:hypothetical protein